MLEFFRSFFKSTLGIGFTLGLLVLIALAFAAGNVASSGGLDGITGGDRPATVGRTAISAAQLSRKVSQAYDRARTDNPRLTQKDFVLAGGLESTLDEMIGGTALVVFGRDHGIIAGKRLIDSELAKIPALQGPDGRFSEGQYRQLLAQRQLSDAEVRDDIGRSLVARQELVSAGLGSAMPDALVGQYAALLKERRTGTIATLPSAVFAPKAPPADAEIAAFYAAHTAAYLRPERRILRYALFDDGVVKTLPAPTDAEIAARYNADKAKYAASESRKVTQLVLISEAVAREVAASVRQGGSLEAAAKARGLATASLGPLSREALAAQTSPAVADAAFVTRQGGIAPPARGALGWVVLRVDQVVTKPARSLEQARGEIASDLAAAKRRAALADLTARVEDSFDHGGALADAAKDLGVTLTSSAPITADGNVFGTNNPGSPGVPRELVKVVQAAFAMEREGEPQLSELVAGKSFVIFDVAQIAPSAPAPLAEIRAQVTTDLMLTKGAAAAKAAALRVLAETKHGKPLTAALATLGIALPPPQPLDMTREQLAAAQAKGRIPAPLGLFFSMAQGTVKLLPGPGNAGWLVVSLAHIEPGTLAANDPLKASTAQELARLAGDEYTDELSAAIRKQVSIRRNETAIRTLATQMTGGN